MPFAVCRKSDGVVRSSARWDRLPFDETSEVLVEVPEMPTIGKRWDGLVGLRDATDEEMTTTAEAKAQADCSRALDTNVLVLAVVRWAAQKLGVPAATARQEILTVYRNLLN